MIEKKLLEQMTVDELIVELRRPDDGTWMCFEPENLINELVRRAKQLEQHQSLGLKELRSLYVHRDDPNNLVIMEGLLVINGLWEMTKEQINEKYVYIGPAPEGKSYNDIINKSRTIYSENIKTLSKIKYVKQV